MMNETAETKLCPPRAANSRIPSGARDISSESLVFLSVMGDFGAASALSGSVYLRVFLTECIRRNGFAEENFDAVCCAIAEMCSEDAEKVGRSLKYSCEVLRENCDFERLRGLYLPGTVSDISTRSDPLDFLKMLAAMFCERYKKICGE